jgi:hypothetical protein
MAMLNNQDGTMKIHEYDLTRSDFCTLANLALGARFLFLGF